MGGTHPALVEAMGAGRPVLYYDTPENREVAGDVGVRFAFEGEYSLEAVIGGVIDDEATYKEAVEFVEQVMPHNQRKLKLYSDPVPLFTRFQIESQIESAFAHYVTLPSGGSMVIE